MKKKNLSIIALFFVLFTINIQAELRQDTSSINKEF